ncbi:MAG TPA: hypothetical protein VJU86_14380 [Pyrinomonadaceae bacterium]|nr:hypothetical protein [Pyrinomonadaceae bacterium]
MNSRVISRSSQLLLIFICFGFLTFVSAAKRRPPGGRIAVVVDERLSALRTTPELSGTLVRRLSRGALVAITGFRTSREGIAFYRINITRRTGGWIQREALASSTRPGDDARLLTLIKGSEEFDRIVRARIFLDHFRLSPLRPEVLAVYSKAAEEAANHLSREASRRLQEKEMNAGGAPMLSYFLNYNGLDRYNRQRITFLFEPREKRFRYDGEGWRELLHRYPQSPQAAEARKRLATSSARR